jgi:RNA polymerase sigma-70 factor (ECF subfamily)
MMRFMTEDPLSAVYDALRKLAEQRLAAERSSHTLQATALVHEVYLKLAGESPDRWADTAHFYHTAAEAMRRVLIDHARARLADKRGGGQVRVPLSESMPDLATLAESAEPDQVLALEEALKRLETISPDAATVVKLRFYAGLTAEQTAATTGISVATVHRKWAYARLFLFRELSPSKKM